MSIKNEASVSVQSISISISIKNEVSVGAVEAPRNSFYELELVCNQGEVGSGGIEVAKFEDPIALILAHSLRHLTCDPCGPRGCSGQRALCKYALICSAPLTMHKRQSCALSGRRRLD